MTQFFSDEDNIYSVDMLIAYVNLFKPHVVRVPTKKIITNLTDPCWGEPEENIYITPLQVIANPEEYPEHARRIQEADLTYPIILNSRNCVIDGVHRLAKTIETNQRSIKAYIIDDKLLEKFLVDFSGDWGVKDQLELHDQIEMFYKRFM